MKKLKNVGRFNTRKTINVGETIARMSLFITKSLHCNCGVSNKWSPHTGDLVKISTSNVENTMYCIFSCNDCRDKKAIVIYDNGDIAWLRA